MKSEEIDKAAEYLERLGLTVVVFTPDYPSGGGVKQIHATLASHPRAKSRLHGRPVGGYMLHLDSWGCWNITNSGPSGYYPLPKGTDVVEAWARYRAKLDEK